LRPKLKGGLVDGLIHGQVKLALRIMTNHRAEKFADGKGLIQILSKTSNNSLLQLFHGGELSRNGCHLERIELTQKQTKILERIQEKGKVSNKDLRGMFGISRQAILKEIYKLIDAKLIELVGKGRNAYYKISD
jgi:predicted HTH transcriptional regulator